MNILHGFMELLGNNIMHRDIKPANILIHNNVYKICDFSWSCYVKDNGNESSGTPKYVSP